MSPAGEQVHSGRLRAVGRERRHRDLVLVRQTQPFPARQENVVRAARHVEQRLDERHDGVENVLAVVED